MGLEIPDPASPSGDSGQKKRHGSAAKKKARGCIVPAGLNAPAEKQKKMLADYIRLTAWWLGRPPMPKLPRRLEQVLCELVGGASEKQVAMKLGVSLHTIHDYTKELHKRLGVNTRSELINRFLPRG